MRLLQAMLESVRKFSVTGPCAATYTPYHEDGTIAPELVDGMSRSVPWLVWPRCRGPGRNSVVTRWHLVSHVCVRVRV